MFGMYDSHDINPNQTSGGDKLLKNFLMEKSTGLKENLALDMYANKLILKEGLFCKQHSRPSKVHVAELGRPSFFA